MLNICWTPLVPACDPQEGWGNSSSSVVEQWLREKALEPGFFFFIIDYIT